MDPTFARLVDEGKVEVYEVEGALDGIIDQIVTSEVPGGMSTNM